MSLFLMCSFGLFLKQFTKGIKKLVLLVCVVFFVIFFLCLRTSCILFSRRILLFYMPNFLNMRFFLMRIFISVYFHMCVFRCISICSIRFVLFFSCLTVFGFDFLKFFGTKISNLSGVQSHCQYPQSQQPIAHQEQTNAER